MTEVYLFFFQSLLPCFNHANQLLQREEPLIHILQPRLLNLFKKLLGKFMKPSVLSRCLNEDALLSVDYKTSSNQLTDKEVLIGFTTKQLVSQLHQEGSISDHQLKNFFKAAREFLWVQLSIC